MIEEFDTGWDRPENVFPRSLVALYRMLSHLVTEGGKRRVRITVVVEENT